MRLPWTKPLGQRLASQMMQHRLWEESQYYGRARKAAGSNGRKGSPLTDQSEVNRTARPRSKEGLSKTRAYP